MVSGLGQRIQKKRIDMGFSQKELASHIGVSPSIVSNYEAGERTPSVENLLALASIFHCSTDYLLGIDKPKSKYMDVSDLSDKEISILQSFINEISYNR